MCHVLLRRSCYVDEKAEKSENCQAGGCGNAGELKSNAAGDANAGVGLVCHRSFWKLIIWPHGDSNRNHRIHAFLSSVSVILAYFFVPGMDEVAKKELLNPFVKREGST